MAAASQDRAGLTQLLVSLVLLGQVGLLVVLLLRPDVEVAAEPLPALGDREQLLRDIHDELASLRAVMERAAQRGVASSPPDEAPARTAQPVVLPSVDPVLERLDTIAHALGALEMAGDGERTAPFPRGDDRNAAVMEITALAVEDSAALAERFVGLSAMQVLKILGAPTYVRTDVYGADRQWVYALDADRGDHSLHVSFLAGWVISAFVPR